jgi:hypothetical protein
MSIEKVVCHIRNDYLFLIIADVGHAMAPISS